MPIAIRHGRHRSARWQATTRRVRVERAGVLVVDSIEELIDVSELLFHYPAPIAGTAVITDSGAFKGLALDYCDTIGLTLPMIEGETAFAPERVLPTFVEATNPSTPPRRPCAMATSIATRSCRFSTATVFGSVVFGIILGSLEASEHRGRRILASIPEEPRKPVIITVLGDDAA